MKTDFDQGIEESLDFIRSRVPLPRKLGIILGSGLGDFAEQLPGSIVLDSAEIPHYPTMTVEGHRGRLVFAELSGRQVVVFQGRVHFYEVGDVRKVVYPVQVAKALGVEILLVTNAAGAINTAISPGDLMVITDQIDLTFERLPMPRQASIARPLPVYDPQLVHLANTVSTQIGILTRTGIYAGVKGPSYETASEVEMLARLGADAVGMSTVLETGFASLLGMRIGGISCITNLAAGRSSHKLSHREVTKVGLQVRERFSRFLIALIEALPRAR